MSQQQKPHPITIQSTVVPKLTQRINIGRQNLEETPHSRAAQSYMEQLATVGGSAMALPESSAGQSLIVVTARAHGLSR